MKIAVLVPDGMGVRNFVLGKFLRQLPEGTKADVFHTIPEKVLSRVQGEVNSQVEWHEMPAYRPNPLLLTVQYSLGYAQMYWADTTSMRRIRNAKISGPLRGRALHKVAKMTGKLCASPARMRALESVHLAGVDRHAEVEWYVNAFKKAKTTILLCSHQRSSIVLPAVLAAKRLGIPTVTFIFSWDNITSKGRIVSPFDHYLVWSRHMASELERYYPDISPDRVHIVGTPQFEPYSDPSLLWSRAEFFQRIGADPSRPLICYSGGDAGTCPEDQEHVRILMELIRDGKIKGNPQVIVRPVPVDDGKRYERVRQTFPDLIYAQPQWVHASPGT
jgi:hypothetical protein